MKLSFLKAIFCGVFGFVVTQEAFAESLFDNIKLFIGTGIGIANNTYEKDVADKYLGISSEVSSNFISGFSYGVNLGFRFVDVLPTYHPGVQLFYEGMNGSAKLHFDNYNVNIHAYHNLIGGAFDNYMLLSRNKSGLLGTNVDRFLVFGLEAGQIKSRYTVPVYSSDTLRDDGNFYGIKLEYLTENVDGVGLTFGIKFLQTSIETLPYVFGIRLGGRCTF